MGERAAGLTDLDVERTDQTRFEPVEILEPPAPAAASAGLAVSARRKAKALRAILKSLPSCGRVSVDTVPLHRRP